MNDIQVISNVRGYLDSTNTAWLDAEDVARGFGFTEMKKGVEYVMWRRVNDYLKTFGFFGTRAENQSRIGKGDFLPENMVYRLGFKANNEVAVKFQTLLADEVLPAIRKTGGYMVANADESPEDLMARALMVAQETLRRKEQRLMEAEKAIEQRDSQIHRLNSEVEQKDTRIAEQTREIAEAAPKVSYYDETLQSVNTVTTTQIAKELGMDAPKLNRKLKDAGILFKQSGQWLLKQPYCGWQLTSTRTSTFTRSDGTTGTNTYTVWSQRGRRFIHALNECGFKPREAVKRIKGEK